MGWRSGVKRCGRRVDGGRREEGTVGEVVAVRGRWRMVGGVGAGRKAGMVGRLAGVVWDGGGEGVDKRG